MRASPVAGFFGCALESPGSPRPLVRFTASRPLYFCCEAFVPNPCASPLSGKRVARSGCTVFCGCSCPSSSRSDQSPSCSNLARLLPERRPGAAPARPCVRCLRHPRGGPCLAVRARGASRRISGRAALSRGPSRQPQLELQKCTSSRCSPSRGAACPSRSPAPAQAVASGHATAERSPDRRARGVCGTGQRMHA